MKGEARPRKWRMRRHRKTVGPPESAPTFAETRALRKTFREFLERHGHRPLSVADAVRRHLAITERMNQPEAKPQA